MQTLKFGALIDVPWKNGGGVTRNIAKGLYLDQSAWTLSRADVSQDGPFSDFAGMVRILTVVSGGTMTLDTPTSSIEARTWEPIRFDGGLKVYARLVNGPLTDLNLMFDPHSCEGEVLTRRGPLVGDLTRPDHGLLVLHVLSGAPAIDGVAVATGDTVFVTTPNVALTLTEDAALLEIRLTYLDQSKAIRLCIAER
ncbi:MAG: HutD family protein [Roseovarius sp.]|jgi:environmental stress-induced protein Ves|nr:HutD family protein [Roseovarius sp.]